MKAADSFLRVFYTFCPWVPGKVCGLGRANCQACHFGGQPLCLLRDKNRKFPEIEEVE